MKKFIALLAVAFVAIVALPAPAQADTVTYVSIFRGSGYPSDPGDFRLNPYYNTTKLVEKTCRAQHYDAGRSLQVCVRGRLVNTFTAATITTKYEGESSFAGTNLGDNPFIAYTFQERDGGTDTSFNVSSTASSGGTGWVEAGNPSVSYDFNGEQCNAKFTARAYTIHFSVNGKQYQFAAPVQNMTLRACAFT